MENEFGHALKVLQNEAKPISYQVLAGLSMPNESDLEQFRSVWPGFSAQRQVDVVKALIAAAEEYFEYYFLPFFVLLLDDANPVIRTLAIEGSREDIKPQLILKFLQMIREDEDDQVRAAAASSLGHVIYLSTLDELTDRYNEEIVETLWAVFHNPQESVAVRRRSLEALSESQHPGVPRIIESAAYHELRLMRISAVFGMGRTCDQRWIPHLRATLKEDDPALRMEAVRALGNLEARQSLDQLILMLDDEKDSEVRLAILEALGQIGGDKAQRALEITLDSDNDLEAEIAEEGLMFIYANAGNTYEIINETLGIADDDDLDFEDSDMWQDFFDDPLQAEIQKLLSDQDYLH